MLSRKSEVIMKRALSGMQPSGSPHLGNYLGAMRQHIAFQETFECFYFLANYHALTTIRNRELLRKYTFDLAADYLAIGLDPEKTVFFRQSDVPEHTELTWIFDTITPMGLLERAHAWKDAKAKGKKDATVGLFNYPVLMAVDILMYSPHVVPVGQDQKQHVEIAADIGGYFNNVYGETFIMPEPHIQEDVAVVPGTDGQKMSKSYGNTIEIFANTDVLKKQVFSIKTDSKSIAESKDPASCIPFKLYQHLATTEEVREMQTRLVEGGIGYAEIKTKLFEKILEYFGEAREKRLELTRTPDFVEDVLKSGAVKARKVAVEMMKMVQEKVGLR